MKQALLDTDTISYYFRNHPKVIKKLDQYLQVFGFLNLSVVTYYEVLNGLYFKDAHSQISRFERFVELNEVIGLTEKSAKRAARIYADLRSKGITISHSDVMIAAIAIENGFTLISNNENHFKHISDLDLDNWVT